ncbi:LLM class flavin-dependent oxidoreductase [Acidisoma silvae]|uniref:LLM class flavin-dependent oxidoreductase n=1 Tax=Acidisoma silvae TaxID=2802396 RepID=A0A963YXJ9_9PROT|nr:LLM class flavin-dependent oxidoreductase [Acidisoma silvae]MCB8877988.1 LLM class flavin-dependent oxidoreductase [Acidisoma silvae]
MSRRLIFLSAFEMNTVGHLAHGLWRHPRDQSSRYTDIDYWMDLARLLERGLFDAVFLADVTGTYDVYGGGPHAAIRHAVQVPINDPMLLVPAMASVTQHLGFGVTVGTGGEAPYLFARRMSTLDHLTRGRIGWNIVTGFLDRAARGRGESGQPDHDERYDAADEFMNVVYGLWESSWADDAVVRDRASGLYAQPEKVRPVRHAGPRFPLNAIHLSEPSPQRSPLLFQAGASARGRVFAVRHGECIFVPNLGPSRTAAIVRDIRAQAVQAGRSPDSLRLLTGLQVIVARTEREAQDKYAEYRRYALPEAGLTQLASATGIDFSRFEADEVIPDFRSNSIQSSAEALAADGQWTVRKLLADMPLGGRYAPIVGSPGQIADAMASWVEETGIDGFNLARSVSPESFADFIDLVVPELQTRGLFKHSYAPGTLREKIFGSPRLPPTHPGAGDALAKMPWPT